jgi:two-component system NtrC family response regulator
MAEEQEKVMVVDDEDVVRSFLQRILEETGYDVITAANGEEALDNMSRLNIGVVFLDVKMPGMSGMEVLAKLTADWPGACVIMATAVVDAQTAVEAMKMGAYDYITKPFSRDDVILKLRRAVEKRDFQLRNERFLVELQQSVKEQSERMQSQFNELVSSLAREHKLLHELAKRYPKSGKELISKLPRELQEPVDSIEEFRNALIRVLRGGK